jgi:hypothetical protein
MFASPAPQTVGWAMSSASEPSSFCARSGTVKVENVAYNKTEAFVIKELFDEVGSS